MRRKVLGYETVVGELKNGNCILSAPMSKNDFMIINNEFCTIRNDFYTTAHKNNIQFKDEFKEGTYIMEIRIV